VRDSADSADSSAPTDTGDSGDTGAPDPTCGRIEGGGCSGGKGYTPSSPECVTEDEGEDGLLSGEVVGGRDTCGPPTPSGLGPAALVALALLLRRLSPRLMAALAPALVGLWAAPAAVAGVNAWNLRTLDGGPSRA